MTNALIQCDQISVAYGKRLALRDISMSVSAGEIVSIIGPNGSGKTSLFKAIIGALTPVTGTIKQANDLSVGYVPQTLHIDETLPITVERFMSLPKRHTKETVAEALTTAGVPGLRKQQLMALSGGQFQRVLLARALLNKPNLLLLDEATQGLDHKGVSDFYRQINHVKAQLGCGIVMISHELHVVMRQTDRVICLNGSICCQGRPEVVSGLPEYRSLFGLDQDFNESAFYLHNSANTNEGAKPCSMTS